MLRPVEHLAKAWLATLHPSLIMEEKDFSSLLHACGHGTLAKKGLDSVKTISLKEAIMRAAQLERRIEGPALNVLADVRNGVAHLAQAPANFNKDVFAPFVRACNVLAAKLGFEKSDIWGAYLSVVETSLSDVAKAAEIRVIEKVTVAKTAFGRRFGTMDASVTSTLLEIVVQEYDTRDRFEARLVECPACGTEALLNSNYEVEWHADFDYEEGEAYVDGVYPIVHSIGDGLTCNACGLNLVGLDELTAANIDPVRVFEDVDSSEVGEPEYDLGDDR